MIQLEAESTQKKSIRMRFFVFLSIACLGLCCQVVAGTQITVINKCHPITIWTGVWGMPQASTTGFALAAGASRTFDVPRPWTSARVWARTHCKHENGRLTCLTGDCGQAGEGCNGATGGRPATTADFTLAANAQHDYFGISNVAGSNLPVKIRPIDGSGRSCHEISCGPNINQNCPNELQVKEWSGYVIGCKSPCTEFGGHLQCCDGPNKMNCPGTKLAHDIFKSRCPQAHSYPHDHETFACHGNTRGYEITFCP